MNASLKGTLVEMICVDAIGSASHVIVTTAGEFCGWHVRFRVAARVVGRRYQGRVYSQSKSDAAKRFCNLVGGFDKFSVLEESQPIR